MSEETGETEPSPKRQRLDRIGVAGEDGFHLNLNNNSRKSSDCEAQKESEENHSITVTLGTPDNHAITEQDISSADEPLPDSPDSPDPMIELADAMSPLHSAVQRVHSAELDLAEDHDHQLAHQSPFAKPVQEMSIKKLRVDCLRKSCTGVAVSGLENVINTVVEKFNNKSRSKGGKFINKSPSQLWWKPAKRRGFSLLVYESEQRIETNIGRMLEQFGQDSAYGVKVSYLFFLYRSVKVNHKNEEEVFALTTSDGYLPVQQFTDYYFPRDIAMRLLDPTKRRKVEAKEVVGAVVSSDTTLREVYFDLSQIQQICVDFKAPLRKDASLFAPPFDQWIGDNKRFVYFEIGQGKVRIHTSLPMDAYPPILNHFSLISRNHKTYKYQPGKQRKANEVMSTDDRVNFAFLEYYTRVSTDIAHDLDCQLLARVAECIINGITLDFDISHPNTREYFAAQKFRLRIGTSEISDWDDGRRSFDQVCKHLRKNIPRQDRAGVIETLRNVSLAYYAKSSFHSASFIDCLTGALLITTEGTLQSMFKLNKGWFAISESLLSRVASEFRELLLINLLEENNEGFLPRPWQTNPPNWSEEKLQKYLGVNGTSIKQLCKESLTVAFINGDGTVLQTILCGDILNNHLIHRERAKINMILQKHGKLSLELMVNHYPKEIATTILEQLGSQRKLIDRVPISRGSQDLTLAVRNPFFPEKLLHRGDVSKYKDVLAKLRQLENVTFHTMPESRYNESYLHTHQNQGIPYAITDPGWIVGDRCFVRDIELFDIMHWTADHLYLYHVKSGFGQSTRDASSQVCNSADLLSHHGGARANILKEFYRNAINVKANDPHSKEYRKAVKEQLVKLGLAGFLQLFEKTLVFVYAFVDNKALLSKDRLRIKTSFTVEDFVDQKHPTEVAENIFSKLIDENILLEDGSHGSSFFALHQVGDRIFESSILKLHREHICNILLGDIGTYGSLIGRLEILHMASRLRKLNFQFRICQIRRPNEVDIGITTPCPVMFGDEDEISSTQMWNAIHQPHLTYQPPWLVPSSEPSTPQDVCLESLVKLATVGDGSCAIHAVFGTWQDSQKLVRFNYHQFKRDEFALSLEKELNSKSPNPQVIQLYLENMRLIIDEAIAHSTRPTTLTNSSVMVFRDSHEVELAEFTRHKQICAVEKEGALIALRRIIEGAVKGRKLLSILKRNSRNLANQEMNLERFREFLQSADDDVLLDVFSKAKRELESEKIFTTGVERQHGHDFSTYLAYLAFIIDAKDKLLQDPSIFPNYLSCLKKQHYWLSDTEVQLLSALLDLRIEIIVEQSGVYVCQNEQWLLPRHEDRRRPVLILSEGSHYSRCIRSDDLAFISNS